MEPWLTGFGLWQRCQFIDVDGATLQDFQCPVANTPQRFVSIEQGSCDVTIRTHNDAVQAVAYAPVCADVAIHRLEELASRGDAMLLNNLAGAYIARARHSDRPSDYVHALATAEKALQRDATFLPARFNAALAQEGLGFLDEAIALWNWLSTNAPAGWKTEAQEHARRLGAQRARERAIQWRITVQSLPDAIAVRDRDPQELVELIRPLRSSAHNYVEEEVLRDWALAAEAGRRDEAERHLAVAEAIASVLEELNRDHYLSDAIALIRSTRNPQIAAALRDGHRDLAKARKRQRDLSDEPSQVQYERAERAFTRAGSPLRLGAALGRITALTQSRQFDAAWKSLQLVEREARRHSYDYVVARVHSARGYYFTVKGSHLQALGQYNAAQQVYADRKDTENLGNVEARKIGLFLEIGDAEEAWRQIVRTRQYVSGEYASRHLLLGESARAAVAIHELGIGLRYQNAAVQLFQSELRQTDERFVPNVLPHLGIAYRSRASIRALAGDRKGAQADLLEAKRLIGNAPRLTVNVILQGFEARLAEARAHTARASGKRAEAIRELTQAIRLAEQTHYRTLLASLLVQRAELHRLDRNAAAELRDLQDAVAALHAEAGEMLKNPSTPQLADQRLWLAFFSRPQESYRRIIRLLADAGDEAAAFNRAEEMRLYEPLHLVYQRAELPSAFSAWLRDRKPYPLDAVKEIVPAGTYLLQYSVHGDRTYLWIVRNGKSEWLTLDVRNEQIEQWAAALQKYADSRNDAQFEQALVAPYAALFQKPLERIAALHGEETPARLIIVPDRAMHGLPFAALSDGKSYMIDRFRVSIAPSATLYAFSLAQDAELAKRAPESVLLVADPAFDTQRMGRGLPQSVPGLRIDRIRRIYAPRVPVTPLVRERATIPQFLQFAPRSSVIHLAAHGIANPDVPSRSYFLLARAGDDTGALDAERLLRELQLRETRLAVLAACSSAGGTAVGPEGLAPLVRPLVVAGVPGVIGTLWNVSAQQETEELLVHFHRHYSNGVDADEALRRAQLQMRNDSAAARRTPRTWAAFQMIGHASSPFRARSTERRR